MRPLFLLPACLFCVTPLAAADEFPKRKPGLWEIKVMMGGREVPLRNIQQCTDAETDALMTTNFNGMAGSACDKPKITSSGDIVTVDTTCKIGSNTTSTRAVFAGDFDSAYTITVSGGPAAGGQSMTMEAKWIGPCRTGQKPGDIIMPGGIKLNVRSLAVGSGGPLGR
ncbi:MAG: DUF3617 family protein [Rhizobiales bacterium]|nr:DUF3617 family protein [Hyphomicrobiales bacterium]